MKKWKAVGMFGVTGSIFKKLLKDIGKDASYCSRWIYLLYRKLRKGSRN